MKIWYCQRKGYYPPMGKVRKWCWHVHCKGLIKKKEEKDGGNQ